MRTRWDPDKYHDGDRVQLNVQIPVPLRTELERYLQYMDKVPVNRRPKETRSWPKTLQDAVETAINEFLEEHPQRIRPGPEKSQPQPIKAKPKQPTAKYQTRIP